MDNKPTYAELEKRIHELEQSNAACQQLLAESRKFEARFRALFQHSPDAVFLTIPEGAIEAANPSACAMFGYSEQEFRAKRRSVIIDESDPRLAIALQERQQTGCVKAVQLTAIRKGGKKFQIEVDSVILPGEPVRSFVIIRDITERKVAEVALQLSEERFAKAFATNPSAICLTGMADSHIVDANPAFTRIFGFTCEEYTGRTILELGLWPTPQDREAAVAELHRQGFFRDRHQIMRTKSGEERQFLASAEAISIGDEPMIVSTWLDITDRKRAEEALRESEERLRLAWLATRDVIWDWDIEKDEQLWNSAGAEVFGWTDAVDSPQTASWWSERIHPDDRQRVNDGFHRVVENALLHQWSDEYRFLRRDGSTANVLDRGYVVRNESGEAKRMIGAMQDITERKAKEEALRVSEERFRVLTQNLVSGVALINEHGEISIVNKAFLQLFDMTEDADILNINSYDWGQWQVFDEAGRLLDVDEHPVRRAARTRTAIRDVLVAMQCPGCIDRKWLLISTEPILNAQGNLHRLICTYHDITERKQAEEALRESERRLSMAITATADAIWEWDLVTNQTYYSPRWFAMLGYEYNEISMDFDGWKSLCHPDDLQPTLNLIQSRLKSVDDAGYAAEFRMLSKDGAWVWILGRGRVVERDEAGKPVLLSGTNTDITERKEAEEAVRQLNESLELQVIERTAIAEVRSKQLQALAVELIETEERERRLFADLLHEDLQQMLAAAKMQVQAVAETISSEPMLSDAVQLLDESIAKSRRLSHQLSPAILHQGGLITALNWLSRQVREHFGLHVELDIETELLMERTPQKVFLFRAVQELLFNTCKHAGVQSARVEVSSLEDSITVTVSDQGRGFDPQILEKRTGNLGLGLLTIKERACYVGGTFVIESTPGQGSRFTLTVPNAAAIGEEEAALGIVEGPNHSQIEAKIPGAGDIHVLFVDDHRVMRQGLMNLVKGQPAIHVAGEASNGREAIEQAHKLLPDVILMDVSMPEMDGIEATRRIKEELPQVRVIGLTMHDDEQISASMNQAGAEVTLSKTLSAAEVVKAIYGAVQ